MNADGTGLRRLTNSVLAQHPAWSPDGAQIAYDSNGAVFLMAADGTGARQLTAPPGADGVGIGS